MSGDKDKDQDYLDQILQETTEDINININLNDINVDEILAEGDLGGDITGEEGRNLQFLQDTQKNLNELAQIENFSPLKPFYVPCLTFCPKFYIHLQV